MSIGSIDAAIAEDDLLLAAIEIQARPLGNVAELLGAGRVLVDFAGRDVFFAAEAAQGQFRLQVAAGGVGGQQPAGLLGGHLAVAHPRSAGQHEVQQRLARAEADAAGAADDGIQAELLDGAARGGFDGPRTMATPQLAEPTMIFRRRG